MINLKEACALVDEDHKPRVYFTHIVSEFSEYRVAYWVPILGVKHSGFCDTYAEAERMLKREDWELRAKYLLTDELNRLVERQVQLTLELNTVTNLITEIQKAFLNV